MSAVETVLYADAMRNVIRGAEAILGPDHAALRAFRKSVPAAVDIRDMLEHFDEYVMGTGKLQRQSHVDPDWRVFASGDISSTTRRLHIDKFVLELPAAHEALITLANVALEAASITAVSEGTSEGAKRSAPSL